MGVVGVLSTVVNVGELLSLPGMGASLDRVEAALFRSVESGDAFLGGVASKEQIDFTKVGVVAGNIKWFAVGVALAVFGMALAYLTHYAMAGIAASQIKIWDHPYVSDGPKTKRWRRLNRTFHICAILVAIGSLALFLYGMIATSDAVTHLLNE